MEPDDNRSPCISPHAEGVTLSVKVSPNAKRTEIQGLWNGKLKVRLKALAVEGQANKALIGWAAEAFGVRLQSVEIIQGEKRTEKVLLLRGVSFERAIQSLDALNPPSE